MATEYHIDLRGDQLPRMEEVFGLVYADTRLTPVPAGALDAYHALCRIYNRVILDTTNALPPSNRGPLARLIRYGCQAGDCAIITFNQDILIEKALTELHRAGCRWFPDNGYVVKFSTYTSAKDSKDIFPMGGAQTSTIPLMKLHGSLNWYITTKSANKVPSRMPKTSTIKCTRNRAVSPQMTYTTNATRGRTTWYTWPVIVPPVYEKGPFVAATLSPIWQEARAHLQNAEQIVVYGYSFPVADQQGRSFFRRARAGNTVLKRLIVINTDPGAVLAAKDIFAPPYVVATATVAAFVDMET
jgi:hypothetical protein